MRKKRFSLSYWIIIFIGTVISGSFIGTAIAPAKIDLAVRVLFVICGLSVLFCTAILIKSYTRKRK